MTTMLPLLPSRPSAGTATAKPAESSLLTVTFLIGPQQYGLPVTCVLEVVRLPALLSLAGAPPAICGLLNLRGHYLPVLDGRTLVGEPAAYDITSQIIIAGDQQAEFGLLVDQVRDVEQLDQRHITSLHHNTAALFLQGVINTDHGSVLLFDYARLRAIVNEVDIDTYQTDDQTAYQLTEPATWHQETDV